MVGGGSDRWWRGSGGAGDGVTGRGASVGVEEGRGDVGLNNGVAEGRRHGKHSSRGDNGGPDSGLRARGKGGFLLWLESLRG